MRELLSSVAEQELTDLPPAIAQCTVNYVPEMGYMLAVPLWDDDLGEEDVQLPNMQLLVSLYNSRLIILILNTFHVYSLFRTLWRTTKLQDAKVKDLCNNI